MLYSTRKATRKTVRSFKASRLNKQNNTNMNTSEEREETGGETDVSMCNLSASTSTYAINNNNKSSTHTSWLFITLGHKSTTVLGDHL